MTPLPYLRAIDLEDKIQEKSWLIEGLWGEEAVGILGGEPKCCKSFLSLEIAIAVSSGKPCLGRYPVTTPGRVLLFAAEDSPVIVKNRLKGVASARGIDLTHCDIQVITCDKIRLDHQQDLAALDATLETLKPRILILDPFVRLHQIDENSSSDVAAILGALRQLQKRHKTSILVVHHAKKSGGSIRAGQALRGSSEFHAWGDSNLYMRRSGSNQLLLSIEHRAAPSQHGIVMELIESSADTLALELQDMEITGLTSKKAETPEERVLQTLHKQGDVMTLSTIRNSCGMRMATLCQVIKDLIATGKILKVDNGYKLLQHLND